MSRKEPGTYTHAARQLAEASSPLMVRVVDQLIDEALEAQGEALQLRADAEYACAVLRDLGETAKAHRASLPRQLARDTRDTRDTEEPWWGDADD